jgi:hypothetical protein
MEHADQAGSLHRDQVAPRQDRPQQANPDASELRSRQPAVETFQCEVEELLEASLRRELVKALEQQKICETLLE